ncbi:MAG: hypothetical protein U0670_10355 [Anaerolineae bacterium]
MRNVAAILALLLVSLGLTTLSVTSAQVQPPDLTLTALYDPLFRTATSRAATTSAPNYTPRIVPTLRPTVTSIDPLYQTATAFAPTLWAERTPAPPGCVEFLGLYTDLVGRTEARLFQSETNPLPPILFTLPGCGFSIEPSGVIHFWLILSPEQVRQETLLVQIEAALNAQFKQLKYTWHRNPLSDGSVYVVSLIISLAGCTRCE